MLPEALQAARLRLVRERPYLASAAWALTPVERPGLGTLAVDRWWRLYYDPAVATRWTPEQLAGVLYHELSHLLRDHPARMEAWGRAVANLATDAEVNDDLTGEHVALPGEPVTPVRLGLPTGRLAEEYAAALSVPRSAPESGASAQPEPGAGEESPAPGEDGGSAPAPDRQGDGDNTATAQDTAPSSVPGGSDGNGSAPSPTAEGGGQADAPAPGDRGDAGGTKVGDASAGSTPSPSPGFPPATSPAPGRPVGNGGAAGTDARPSGESGADRGAESSHKSPYAGPRPRPGAGRCGSCATGAQEPWEDGPPGEGNAPGLSQAQAELVRREVARAIRESSEARGTIPGHWRRWAEEKLRPRVDWRRELAAAVRSALADTAGAADYSYRRPSRRQGQVGNGRVIFPALRRPVPEVAVVVDTSGSMGQDRIAQALAEVAGVLRAAGTQGVTVLAVDAAVQSCRRVFDPRQVTLVGGGGTDMTAGLEAVARLRPRPQVAVVITDGHTPWPDAPPRGAQVVVVLVGSGEAPPWARVVRVEDT